MKINGCRAAKSFSFDKKGVNGKELKGSNLNFALNIFTVLFGD